VTAPALAALLSHWRRRPLQLGALVLGLALATALWTGVQAINAEARASYDTAADALGRGSAAVIGARSGAAVPVEAFAALRRAGWRVSPVLEGPLFIDGRRYQLIGVEPLTAGGGLARSALGDASGAEFLTPPGLVFAAPETAARLDGAEGLPPLRADPAIAPQSLLTDIAVAERLLDRPGEISYFTLPGAAYRAMNARSPDAVWPGLEITAPQAGLDAERLTGSFHLNLTAFGFLAFAVGLFIVHATIGLAFEQRRQAIRTLRAVGVSLNRLTLLLLGEGLVLSLAAGLIGVALGYVVASALLPGVAATLRGLYGAQVSGELALRPDWILSGIAIAVLGGLAAMAQTVARLRSLPILAAAQPRAWSLGAPRRRTRQAIIALALFAAAAAAARFGHGLVSGFALLGALLLGAALALPLAAEAVLRLGERLARRPVPAWFWADTRQQLSGLSLALMALLLALAANIGVGTMVSSFRATFEGWLDQRLAAELYVTAESAGQAERIEGWLEDRADAVLPIVEAEARIAARPVDVFGARDHATYRDHWPLLASRPGAWDSVAAGEGALINEQLWRRAGLALGERVALDGWRAEIVGVYSDYGNPRGQAIVSLTRFETLFPGATPRRFGVRVDPGRAEALSRDLKAAFGLGDDAVIDQAAIKAYSIRVFDRTFAVTGALNILTLSVAAFAMLASLLTLSNMRLPQLAPAWALGLTRRRLALLEMLRALALAMIAMAAAVPTGLALAWALLAIVNVEAFGWRLPLHLYPLDWLRLAGLAALAALAAAALPARRLATRPPGELLKIFAQER